MSEAKAKVAREKFLAGLGGALLLITLLMAYANHFHNSFHFDDAHTIVNNASIRELRNIPLFFRDATTFSSLPSNQSYRPLVSTLLAIDYRLGRTTTVLVSCVDLRALRRAHACCSRLSSIACLMTRQFHLVTAGSRLLPRLGTDCIPANADTVNYMIASSEVISTLGVIASFAVYFAFPRLRRSRLYIVPAAIAILAKPTAAIFAVLFAIYRLLFPDGTIIGRTTGRRALAYFTEIVPSFLICGAMLLFVQHMTPNTWVAGAANAHNYMITQPYVIFQYFKTFFWPTGLSADYDLNPFTTTDDPRFWARLRVQRLFHRHRYRGLRF